MTNLRPSLEPSTAEIKRVLAEQNPWHFDGKVPLGLAMGRERPLARSLWRRLLANEPRRFQIVLGPRRVARPRRCTRRCGRSLHRGCLPTACGGEFLHLIHEAPEIAASGTLAETLLSLTQTPIHVASLRTFRQRFSLIGGFPELLLSSDSQSEDDEARLLRSQRVLRSDAVERAIYKDIPQAFGVNDPLLLERMLYTLAGQMTGLLSPSTLSKNLGLSQPTFDRYLSYLERAFIVFTLSNYSGNEGAVQRRGRKLYFVDGAVRSAALQRGTAPLSDPQEMGLLIENMAASHLHALSQQSQVRVYHWRHNRDEVDLVYDDPAGPLAFELGSGPSHPRGGLEAFLRKHPRFGGGAWYIAPGLPAQAPGQENQPWGTLPLELFLLAVGRQAAKGLERRLA